MELNRRWFMLGSASAIAAATIPATASFIPLPAQSDYAIRRILEMNVYFGQAGYVWARRTGAEEWSMHFGGGDGSIVRWVAMPGGEWVMPRNVTYDIKYEPMGTTLLPPWTLSPPRIDFVVEDTDDAGRPERLLETHDLAAGTKELIPMKSPPEDDHPWN